MENKDKPAYPLHEKVKGGEHEKYLIESGRGLTKREVFAMAAMQGILASRALQVCLLADTTIDGTTSENCFAVFAAKQADELLKQLES